MSEGNKRWTAKEISKSLLFKTLTYRAGGFLGKPLLLLQLAQKALSKANKDSSLSSVAVGAYESLSRLVRLVKAYAAGTYRDVSKANILKLVGTILYFVTPLDLVPDVIPLVGLLDDITLMGWMISTLGEELTKFEAFEMKHDKIIEID